MVDRLRVDGRGLETAWYGDESAHPPIVLLHEGLGSVSMWHGFPAALAAHLHRRVFAYSRPGHGQSDIPAAPLTTRFMHDEAINRLPRMLDAAGIDRAVLFGHSDGGSIALIAATTSPERTEALVLEAPHVFVEDVSIRSIERMKAAYEQTDLRARLMKHHRDVDAAFRGWNDVWLDPAFRAWNIEEYLPRVTCPVLLIQGEQDEYGTLGQIQAIASGVAGPVQQLILPDCGHSPHRDQPKKVLGAIDDFLQRPA